MSSKHRHGLPKKRPDVSKKAEIDADLPTLEPVADDLPTLEPIADELPTLEPVDESPAAEPVVDDGPVKARCAASEDANFDAVLTVTVPAMDKKAVPDAIAGPLRRVAAAAATQLRHKRVLVRFDGEAVIGSAVKELVATTLKAQKPVKVVVRRGFGDETVFEGALPTVKLHTSEQGGAMRVEVATGELEAQDLPMALQPQLAALAVTARGRKFVLHFSGAAKPDAAVRTMVTEILQGAGATRAAIGERVLFDKEMAERVRVVAAADAATVDVQPADDEMSTVDAISMVLPQHAAAFQGRIVRLRFAKAARPAELAACVEVCKKASASRIELAAAAGAEPEILWPKLLQVTAGSETTLRVQPNGRGRAAVLAAFRRECAEHAAATKGAAVVVDWPAAFAIDAEAEACLRDAGAVLGAKALACTVGGDHREPFLPEAVGIAVDGDRHTLRIRGDAGKPVELQRAIDRRMAAAGKGMRGKVVRVQVTGGVALSRTLLRSVCTAVDSAGASRVELEDNGAVDVLLPPMLAVTKQSANEVRIAADAGGRDQAQQALALRRELDVAALPTGAVVAVADGPSAEAVVAAVLARGASRVLLDGPAPVQVHPPLFAAPEKKPMAIRLVVAPGVDATMVDRQLTREMPGVLAGLGTPGTATVTVVWPGASPANAAFARLLQGLVEKKATKVLLDAGDGKPQQVHPQVAPKPVPAPVAAPAAPAVAMAADAAMPAAANTEGLITLLARNDGAVPPTVVLGIAAGTEPLHVAAVEAALRDNLPRLRGRCVLFVLRAGDQDVPVRRDNELVAALRRVTAPVAAATLVFRGPDAQDRPHFQVVHSTVRAFPVGSAFADPRARRATTSPAAGAP